LLEEPGAKKRGGWGKGGGTGGDLRISRKRPRQARISTKNKRKKTEEKGHSQSRLSRKGKAEISRNSYSET